MNPINPKHRNFSEQDFSNTDHSGAKLNDKSFRKCNLSNSKFLNIEMRNTNFQDSNLSHSTISGIVDNVSFKNCDLTEASFLNISFSEPLQLAELNITRGTRFENCKFQGVLITKQPFDFSGGMIISGFGASYFEVVGYNFENAFINNAQFDGCKLISCRFHHAELTNVNFSEARLRNTYFEHASLKGAIFTGVSEDYSDGFCQNSFEHADLTDADFSNANFVSASFKNANLKNTNFKGTVMPGVEGLTQAQIDQAIGDSETRLPGDLQTPASWL